MKLASPVLVGLVVASGAWAVGCGGVVAVDTPADGSTSTDGNACVSVAEGAACSPSQVPCQPPGDPCCVGWVWGCDGATRVWKKLGLGCMCRPDAGPDPSTFACGTSTCGGKQMCVETVSDAGSSTFVCKDLPSSCGGVSTCGCVRPAITKWCACTEDAGRVRVRCVGA